MNLYALLHGRAADGESIRIGVIGAGKFGTMFLAQARTTPGMHVVAVADLAESRARRALDEAGFEEERASASSFAEALASGATYVTEDAEALISAQGIEVVVEATGSPTAGARHALLCFDRGRHVVMVNVEADALVGPLLARRAQEAGVVYSLAYGDQPAIICEMVDWARASGFEVVCAGKGTKYLPEYHASTPDTVWDHYGFTDEQVESGGLNPRMFNSFIDGTKSAIEMVAVANATGLTPAPGGLGFPPAGADKLAAVCRPRADGGSLDHSGTVEVVSSLGRDGRFVERDLRWGVYVTFRAATDYVARCFSEYGLATDDSGYYAALYRPFHLIGLELGVSVAYAALRREATGAPTGFRADVVATAKRDLRAGEELDGEGGYAVYGRLMPAEDSMALEALPIGLAHGTLLRNAVTKGQVVKWSDISINEDQEILRLRREMEGLLPRGGAGLSGPASAPGQSSA
ncbi:MAG: Gfo/Idh/MocA family oxidoreductase [Rubrobacter sp.]